MAHRTATNQADASSVGNTDSIDDHVRKFRGCLALCFAPESPLLAALEHTTADPEHALLTPQATERLPTQQWHITLVTKAELQALSAAAVTEALALRATRVFPLRIASCGGVTFIVCLWPRGQAFRKAHGLPLKDFHVTMTAYNSHAIDKTVATALRAISDDVFSTWLDSLPIDTLEALARQLLLEEAHALALQVATHLCATYSTQTTRGWLRLGDAALRLQQYKLAMLSFACAYMQLDVSAADASDASTHEEQQRCCLAAMQTCSAFTEWGRVFFDHERFEVPQSLAPVLLYRSWSSTLRQAVRASAKPTDRCTASREQLWVVQRIAGSSNSSCPNDAFYRLPRFFRWLVPFHVAAMSTPRSAMDVAMLSQQLGIRHVVTLTKEQPLPSAWFRPLLPQSIRNTLLAVDNYAPPTLAQVDLFIHRCCCSDEDVDTGATVQPVLVHCGGGKGRAGVMLACYLVAFGFQAPPRRLESWTQPAMAADAAIQQLRAIRPGSIETPQQEAAVTAYSSLLWKRRSVLPAYVEEPLASAPIVDGAPLDPTDLLVLCGLPGAGKTTFRRMLVTRSAVAAAGQRKATPQWLELSGDEHGGRTGCERSIGFASTQRAILDRVNGTRADRVAFLQLAATWSQHATAVWFDLPVDVCTARAQQRPDHPTLPPGRRVENAIAQHAQAFTVPTLAEGFATVVRVTSIEAAQALSAMLTPAIGLLRFPRTSHVLDLGAVSADDLVMAPDTVVQVNNNTVASNASDNTVVVVTEKLDGANLGLSLAADGYSIVVQNRSHYVCAASHTQFRKLDAFIAQHAAVLRAILKQDPLVPERYVLYGEWMAATHSIAYTKLHALFYAFDLFDRALQRFWDRASLEALLCVTATSSDGSASDIRDGVNASDSAGRVRIELVPLLWSGSRLPDTETLIRMTRETPSQFFDGVIEGLYIKWETPADTNSATSDGIGHVRHRGKLVRGDFIAGNDHWTKHAIRFNTIVSNTP